MAKRYSRYWLKLKKKIGPKSDYFLNRGIEVDYKDVATLSKFVNRQGRIVPRIYSKLTAKNQRKVAKAIKKARQMALLPYTSQTRWEEARLWRSSWLRRSVKISPASQYLWSSVMMRPYQSWTVRSRSPGRSLVARANALIADNDSEIFHSDFQNS